MNSHGLTDRQLNSLRRSLAPWADVIDRVAVFGSRATGRWRPASDIDLVIFGTPTDLQRLRMAGALDDSDLPVTVDIVVYDQITSAELKAHIDRVALSLFTREELREASRQQA